MFLPESRVDFGHIRAACAIALHMHQPLIPAGGGDLYTAAIISNLQYMMENQGIGDNYNAPVFHWCYKRIGEFVPQLIDEGKEPRVMLEYSGTLFHGLRAMGLHDALDALKNVTCNPAYRRGVEWLGCPWGHAVAPFDAARRISASTSKPGSTISPQSSGWRRWGGYADFRPRKWPCPTIPILPTSTSRPWWTAAINGCWCRNTVEQPETAGDRRKTPTAPVGLHQFKGETVSIIAIVKTQGSDTKLVAQMQPYYEAKSLSRWELAGKSVPPLVTPDRRRQERRVMMNEFPGKFFDSVREASGSDTPFMNATEYLEHLFALGIWEADLPTLKPQFQKRIWDRFQPGGGPEKLEKVIAELKQEDGRFHMEGGSWTNDISWVRGYDNVLGPMEKASSQFFEKVLKPKKVPQRSRAFAMRCSI